MARLTDDEPIDPEDNTPEAEGLSPIEGMVGDGIGAVTELFEGGDEDTAEDEEEDQ